MEKEIRSLTRERIFEILKNLLLQRLNLDQGTKLLKYIRILKSHMQAIILTYNCEIFIFGSLSPSLPTISYSKKRLKGVDLRGKTVCFIPERVLKL